MRTHWLRIGAASLMLAAMLASCSPTAGFPSGTYHASESQAAAKLVFSEAGTLSTIDSSGAVVDTASFQVSENEIAIQSDTTCPNTAGIYTWSLDGQTLKLTFVSDDCPERREALTASDWIKE